MLTVEQNQISSSDLSTRVFLAGPAGTGKTTAAVARVLYLLKQGVPGDQILIWVPQQALAFPYQQAMRTLEAPAGFQVNILTLGGLAWQMVDLFWPEIARKAGFSKPDELPIFLNLEAAQFHMRRIVAPMLEDGMFDGLALDRNRLYSQILDNLNKAAVVGFPHSEIGLRLNDAWIEQVAQRQIYQDAQKCASAFREACYQHNLVDFSLAVELFREQIWPNQAYQSFLKDRYRFLVVENCEEDTPVSHDILSEWLPECQSALVLQDEKAGFRSFLGADPTSSDRLREACEQVVYFEHSFVTSPKIESTIHRVSRAMGRGKHPGDVAASRQVFHFEGARFFPQMLDWVADQISSLVFQEGIPPGEIVVLAPYLSDALQFSLVHRLEGLGIPVQTHRPSRALRDEPSIQCLLTLARLAHPAWKIPPQPFDVANALVYALDGLDFVRAQLMVGVLYSPRSETPELRPFDAILASFQERISYLFGERYEHLRTWLAEYANTQGLLPSLESPPDHFFSRLFGEVLSQPGYRFHHELDHGRLAANLIQSAREFRKSIGDVLADEGESPGKQFVNTVAEGVIAAAFVPGWESHYKDAVLVAPAYTYLLSNRPVTCQFWLNPGSRGWWERVNQPLTHPYVLSRQWQTGQPWRDSDEYEHIQENLYRLLVGLLRRCRGRIYLGLSQLDEQGNESQGLLVAILNRVLRDSIVAAGGEE